MELTVHDLAKMMDASCVRTYSTRNDIRQLCETAEKYQIGQIAVMQCYIRYAHELLSPESQVKVVGNVSFPSGSDSTSLKMIQAKEMLADHADEIDMVMNIAELLSGQYQIAADDVKAVRVVVTGVPLKVIIEISYLNLEQTKKACEIAMEAGAAFVKTGTGWAEKGTTLDDVRLIKSLVGDRIKIKASGGIRDLNTMCEMIRCGANRVGVNVKSARSILEECMALGGKVTI